MRSAAPSTQGAGLAFAVGAYGLWGLLPVYFLSLEPTGPVEIVAWRIVLSLVFCFLLLAVTRGWASLRRTILDRRAMLLLGLAGALIVVNWLTYVVATLTGHVVEAALGYFLNPIVTVLLGVLVLHERLRPAQWAAIGISAVAALVLAVGYGSVPVVALTLAFSFGFYGLVKKKVGPNVDAIVGLTVETAWLTPLALGGLAILAATTGLTLGAAGPVHLVLLLSAGVVTAVPLLFFAAAARRLPLTLVGLVQYLAPLLQFVLGVTVLAEPMPIERWVGFGLVWLALLVLSIDLVVAGRSPRRASLEPA
ncbi:EamA family transporter RarD [Lysobacter korlensis]|uniref:EamA family transporter RarD n=1 Tax=Lysobacter korlensis TaxID=553636 RepID=A0ABV6RUX1_9GAMM